MTDWRIFTKSVETEWSDREVTDLARQLVEGLQSDVFRDRRSPAGFSDVSVSATLLQYMEDIPRLQPLLEPHVPRLTNHSDISALRAFFLKYKGSELDTNKKAIAKLAHRRRKLLHLWIEERCPEFRERLPVVMPLPPFLDVETVDEAPDTHMAPRARALKRAGMVMTGLLLILLPQVGNCFEAVDPRLEPEAKNADPNKPANGASRDLAREPGAESSHDFSGTIGKEEADQQKEALSAAEEFKLSSEENERRWRTISASPVTYRGFPPPFLPAHVLLQGVKMNFASDDITIDTSNLGHLTGFDHVRYPTRGRKAICHGAKGGGDFFLLCEFTWGCFLDPPIEDSGLCTGGAAIENKLQTHPMLMLGWIDGNGCLRGNHYTIFDQKQIFSARGAFAIGSDSCEWTNEYLWRFDDESEGDALRRICRMQRDHAACEKIARFSFEPTPQVYRDAQNRFRSERELGSVEQRLTEYVVPRVIR